MLVAQFDKCVVLSKRKSEVTDDKTGKTRSFLFLTGFDAVSGSVFTDLALMEGSPVSWDDIRENVVYDSNFVYSNVNDGKNVKRLASVKLVQAIGELSVKAIK
jgi:hypothetical protein